MLISFHKIRDRSPDFRHFSLGTELFCHRGQVSQTNILNSPWICCHLWITAQRDSFKATLWNGGL